MVLLQNAAQPVFPGVDLPMQIHLHSVVDRASLVLDIGFPVSKADPTLLASALL